jgi:predicted RNA-binding protein with PIN domain
LETARRRLLEFLHERLEPLAETITVVFDAKRKPGHVPSEVADGKILVRYAGRNEEADDVIEALIAKERRPKRLVVVSEDRRLRDAAVRHGARSWGCRELLDHLERRPRAAQEPSAAAPAHLSKAEVEEWLREFDGLEIPQEYKEFLDPPPENE